MGLYTLAKSRAKTTGVPFTITIDDVRAVYPVDGQCPVLRIPFLRGRDGKVLESSPTLDRLNNQWGYEPGNIAVISYRANRAKGGLTAHELEQIAQWMRLRGLD